MRSTCCDPASVELVSPLAEVAIWRVDLDSPALDDPFDWLSPSEIARAGRFAFAGHARRFRTGRAALRQRLALHCGFPPRAEFGITAHGKPVMPAPFRGCFNFSRSGGLALVVIGTQRRTASVGVDIERVQAGADLDALAATTLTPAERVEFAATPGRLRAPTFLSAWTRKEACLKALGTGLLTDPATVEVGFDGATRAIDFAGTDGSTARIALASLELDGGAYLAAVASTSSAVLD